LIHVTQRFRALLVATKLDRVLQSVESEKASADSDRRV
jgi:hypothetical protein